jgi:hypothetical protein
VRIAQARLSRAAYFAAGAAGALLGTTDCATSLRTGGSNAVDEPDAWVMVGASNGPLYGGFCPPVCPSEFDAGDSRPDATAAGDAADAGDATAADAGDGTAGGDATAASDAATGDATVAGDANAAGDAPNGTDGADDSSDGAGADAP